MFNPFKNRIGSLTVDDLNLLISEKVAEGYHVEYKSEFVDNRKIGRSLASFANTYGGWYIVGVSESGHVADQIPGFDLSTVPDPIARIRDVARSHIDPPPLFFSQLVEVGQGRHVLVVQVPDYQDAPFITSDGRFYRRVSDSSEPIHESNRYAIDKLYDMGKEYQKHFERFASDNRILSKRESDWPWINIYLLPYPLGTIDRYLEMSELDNFRRVLKRSTEPIDIPAPKTNPYSLSSFGSGYHAFNSIQHTHESVILRDVPPGAQASATLSAELFHNGGAKFHIPMSKAPVDELPRPKASKAATALDNIFNVDLDHNEHSLSLATLNFIDFVHVFARVCVLMNYYRDWLGKENWVPRLRYAIELTEVWRCVFYMDSDNWGEYVAEFGLPVLHTDDVRIPSYFEQGVDCDPNDDNIPIWVFVCYAIGYSVGFDGAFVMAMISESLQAIANAVKSSAAS